MKKNLLILILAILATTAPAWAGEGCVVGQIPEAVVLPDGTMHDAGTIRLCHAGAFSPTATFHEVVMGKHSTGRFVATSRTTEGEGNEGRAFIVLERWEKADHLVLVGYGLHGRGGEVEMHWLQLSGKPRTNMLWQASSRRNDMITRAPELNPAADNHERVILVARNR